MEKSPSNVITTTTTTTTTYEETYFQKFLYNTKIKCLNMSYLDLIIFPINEYKTNKKIRPIIKEVRVLLATHNFLSSIKEICFFRNLTKLNLNNNNLTNIRGIGRLVCLKELYLENNQLHVIREKEIQKLLHLEILDVTNNKYLKCLPNTLPTLPKLTKLYITFNQNMWYKPTMRLLHKCKSLKFVHCNEYLFKNKPISFLKFNSNYILT
jgi:Leucine-rich repeat (LRR) protein